jgi:hypothetical protein
MMRSTPHPDIEGNDDFTDCHPTADLVTKADVIERGDPCPGKG